MVEMELLGVQVEMPSQSPLLLLRETGGSQRVLPVVIDTPEAQAIYRGIEQIRVPRPLTHDLMAAMLDVLGATLVKVTVTDLRDRTFFAEMEVTIGSDTHTISARPSDAVALAVRADTPSSPASRCWTRRDRSSSSPRIPLTTSTPTSSSTSSSSSWTTCSPTTSGPQRRPATKSEAQRPDRRCEPLGRRTLSPRRPCAAETSARTLCGSADHNSVVRRV